MKKRKRSKEERDSKKDGITKRDREREKKERDRGVIKRVQFNMKSN
jgi:hypothetical protein